jgi:hypothetical protein
VEAVPGGIGGRAVSGSAYVSGVEKTAVIDKNLLYGAKNSKETPGTF